MTRKEITQVEAEIAKYNSARQKEAEEKFRKGPVPKMKWMMGQILERLLGRLALVKSGKAPDELGSYTRDELARILATKTCVEHDCLSLNLSAAVDAEPGTSLEDVSYFNTVSAWTPEFGRWRQIVTALGEYLHAAAVFAKSANASSTAARLFLRAWRIALRIEDCAKSYGCATRDQALSIVRLERVAADRLWVDVQFAALPPFRKPKKSTSRKAKGKNAD